MTYEVARSHLALFEKDPVFDLVSPRSYCVPNGYVSPKILGVTILSSLLASRLPPEMMTHPILHRMILGWELVEQDVPLYFVGRDFITDVTYSKPPLEMPMGELAFPFPAVSYALPEDFSRAYFGSGVVVPFISACKRAGGEVKPPERILQHPKLRDSWPVRGPAGELFIVSGTVFFPNGSAVDYTACLQSQTTLGEGLSLPSDFEPHGIDVLTHEIFLRREDKDTTLEEDRLFLHGIIRLAVWLLLGTMAMPEHVEAPIAVYPPKKLGGGRMTGGTWQPRWLGRKYIMDRPHQGGTHASPRVHRKSGHFKRVRFGEKRSQVKVGYIKPYWAGKQVPEPA